MRYKDLDILIQDYTKENEVLHYILRKEINKYLHKRIAYAHLSEEEKEIVRKWR